MSGNSRNRWLEACVLALVLAAAPFPAFAESYGTPFSQGMSRFSLQVGTTRAFDRTYTAIGLGAGYYIADGLELGLDGDAWFGNTPHIYRMSPGLRYVFPLSGSLKPYAGIFYRRTFIGSAPDQNEAGGRAGVTALYGPRTTFSLGVVYDARINCDRTVYSSCSEVYPELAFSVLF